MNDQWREAVEQGLSGVWNEVAEHQLEVYQETEMAQSSVPPWYLRGAAGERRSHAMIQPVQQNDLS